MEREACVCDHGFERSDLCAEIIIIIIIIIDGFGPAHRPTGKNAVKIILQIRDT